MVHKDIVLEPLVPTIRHRLPLPLGTSRTILVTRYTLASRAKKEANNELKAWLFGSDQPTLSGVTRE